MFAEDQRHRIQRVFGKELRAADDDGNEADRVHHVGDEFAARNVTQRHHGGSHPDSGQAHGETPGKAGERQRIGGAPQLLVRAVFDLLEDLLCGTPQRFSSCH